MQICCEQELMRFTAQHCLCFRMGLSREIGEPLGMGKANGNAGGRKAMTAIRPQRAHLHIPVCAHQKEIIHRSPINSSVGGRPKAINCLPSLLLALATP